MGNRLITTCGTQARFGTYFVAMKRSILVTVLGLIVELGAAAQTGECAKVTRDGDAVTIVADSIRPVDSLANTLSQQFGISVSAEEPQYKFPGDYEDVSVADPRWSAEHPKAHYQVPKRRRIEIRFSVSPNGTPSDVGAVLQELVKTANQGTAFGYRLDVDGEFFTLVPTTTRNPAGDIVPAVPLLDRKVTIPPGTRRIAESATMMADSLSVQSGLRVSCCQSFVAGIPWGMSVAPFESQNQPARKVLQRLILLNQQLNTISSRNYWVLRCDNGWCFIDIKNVFGAECR